MLTRVSNGKVLRKAKRSGAGNDCVFMTSITEPNAQIDDSKTDASLNVNLRARAALLRFAATR